jgi:hypothetical protein
MPLHSEGQTLDLEDEDRVDTVIIGLRYTGSDSAAPARKPRRQGGWPGRAPFQAGPVVERDDDGTVVARDPGPIQVGVNPDWIDDDTVAGGTLAGLEALADFEVIYDPAAIAEAMLRENYLPPAVFGGDGTPPDYDIRERVFDFLDIPQRLGTAESPEAEKAIREALAETAGIDTDDTEDPIDRERVQELKQGHSRNDLVSAASEFDWSGEAFDSLATAKKHALAERLADEDAADVREALADDEE